MMAPKLKPRILLKQSEALFDRYETESKIDKALARKVWIKNGSYIIIDRTEALTCIDVNTGKFVGKDNLEKTITATNCEAAREIARQLRLRDIGGIIIIDFIDMERESKPHHGAHTLKTALKEDHTRSHVFGFTHLGLVEMTRKKTGRSLGDTLQTLCPLLRGGRARALARERHGQGAQAGAAGAQGQREQAHAHRGAPGRAARHGARGAKATAPCSRRRRAAHTMCAQTTRCTSKSSPCARWPSGAWRRRKRTAKSCIDTAAGLW